MSKGIFCALAHNAATISQDPVKPCCNLQLDSPWIAAPGTSNFDLNHGKLVQLRKDLSAGIWPVSCANCKNDEENGHDSMRLRWNSRIETDQLIYSQKHHMSMSDVLYLDITIDTFCNSKCMMCGPGASSFWEKEHSYIWGDKALAYEVAPADRVNFTLEDLQSIAKETTNLQHVSFLGGEPTISDLHFEFLTMLIDTGRAASISLSYVTNLTGITQEMLDIWGKFKHVSLTVSIDGYGSVNEYIRYPISWKKTIATLKKAKEHNLGLSVSCSVSVFNCLDTVELFRWWDEFSQGEENYNFILNRVMFHEYNNLSLLSNEYRQQGVPILENYITETPNCYMENNAKQMINYLLEPQITSAQHIDDLVTLITRSDQFRKRSINDYIPRLFAEIKDQQKKLSLLKRS